MVRLTKLPMKTGNDETPWVSLVPEPPPSHWGKITSRRGAYYYRRFRRMDAIDQEYGAGMPILDKLRLLAEWAPLLGRLQAVAEATDAKDRALRIVGLLRWAAGQSDTKLDDEALAHIEAVLRTKEGEALFLWVAGLVGGDQ